jgi:hypothetical protein
MYAELTQEKLLQEASWVKNFVIVKGYDENNLIELGTKLKEQKEGVTKIYWINGGDSLNYPSFSSIRMNPRFVIKDKDIRSSTDGLIFPQHEPIILIIANFNKLKDEDKEIYVRTICKKEERDYHPHLYLHEESIVILDVDQDDQIPQISYKLEVRNIIE